MHFEYPLTREETFPAMKSDLRQLRTWLTPPVCNQKTIFSEKSMLLGSDAEFVTVPKAELVGLVLGAAKTG